MSDYLYLHIPFCVRKCIYCDFFSLPYDEALARRYADALCRELDMRKYSAGELKAIYFGGGTPSILPADCLRRVFGRISDSFSISDTAEITVEANPGTVTEPFIETLLSLGVNRLSIGVQSFRDQELKVLGRVHDATTALSTIELIRAKGLNNFSIDLMYGIPGQTGDSWRETLAVATGLSPAHISAYELTPERGTALNQSIQSGLLVMPDEALILEMYDYATDYLASEGYEHYEISNYAQPGSMCAHNLNYWDRGQYIGAGAGAHSFLDGMRWMNTKNIGKYITDIESNILPREDIMEMTSADASREFLFLGLRKIQGISLEKSARLGIHIQDACRDLVDAGCIEVTGDSVSLSRKGLVLSNSVIVEIFERLGL